MHNHVICTRPGSTAQCTNTMSLPGQTSSLCLMLWLAIWLIDVSAQVCTMTPSAGAKAASLKIATDRTCAKTVVGCLSTVCRYCRLPQATSYTNLLWCSQVTGLYSRLPTPAPTTVPPAFMLSCSVVASAGDTAVGIAVINDVTCVLGGLGCIGYSCRQCRVFNTSKSAHLTPCSTFRLNNGDDIQFTRIPYVVDNSGLPRSRSSPVYPTRKPAVITFPTSPPVLQPASVAVDPCSFQVANGDTAVGISAATDPSCSKGGVGCFSLTCRYCQNYYTESSAHLLPCSSFKLETLVKDQSELNEVELGEPKLALWIAPVALGGTIAVIVAIVFVRRQRQSNHKQVEPDSDSEPTRQSPAATEEPSDPVGELSLSQEAEDKDLTGDETTPSARGSPTA